MASIDKMVKDLPPEMRRQVEEFARSLVEGRAAGSGGGIKLDWRGLLESLKDRYTSVELQHRARDWWTG